MGWPSLCHEKEENCPRESHMSLQFEFDDILNGTREACKGLALGLLDLP